MATILTLAAGLLGFFTGTLALVLGVAPLTALLIWVATGVSGTILGISLAMIPRHHSATARA